MASTYGIRGMRGRRPTRAELAAKLDDLIRHIDRAQALADEPVEYGTDGNVAYRLGQLQGAIGILYRTAHS